MDKQFRRHNVIFLMVLFLLLALFIISMLFLDPMFHYHQPFSSLSISIDDGRYQNAGIAKYFDFDNLLLGTSVSANFSAAQFDDLFGGTTVKLICLDGFFSDFTAALDIALANHHVDKIFWGIDSNILARAEDEKTVELPLYLYNETIWDDSAYILNKDIFFEDALPMLMGENQSLDQAIDTSFYWGEDLEWSQSKALRSYARPQVQNPVAENYFLSAAQANLQRIIPYITAYPETEFYFYLAPYSILYWDQTIRNGELEAVLAMHRLVLQTLCQYENAHVYYFMNNLEIIGHLDNYTDSIHYSPQINCYLAEQMSVSPGLTAEDIEDALSIIEAYAVSYDYQALFL